MPDFLVLDHTADTGILATGRTLREAFESAASGLFYIIAETNGIRPLKNFTFTINGDNLEEIFIKWLNHLLFIHEVEKVLLCQFKIQELSPQILKAIVSGEEIDLTRHEIKTYVKAATYHELVVATGDPAKVQVIFDV